MRGKKTGGRSKGTPNKATADVMALAGNYADSAMRELARLATGAESEQARVAACREILDRAYGKPAQHVAHSGTVTLEGLIAQSMGLQQAEAEESHVTH